MESGVRSCGGEFVLQSCEDEYRAAHLREYVHQVRLCFVWAVILNSLFVLSDWRFHGQPHFRFALSARALILAMSFACLAALPRVCSFRQFQLVCLTWTFPVIAAGAVLVTPHTDIALLVTFILPAIFYLAIPVSFRLAVLCGVVSSVAALGAYISPRPFSETSLGLLVGMLMSNAVWVLVLSQSNRLRRLEWAATEAQRAANRELTESQNTLQKIVRAVPTPLILAAKEDGSLIQANDAARAWFGSSLRRSSFQIKDHIDRQVPPMPGHALQGNLPAAESESRLVLADGSVKDVLLEETTMTLGGTEAVLTILVDISQRKKVEVIMKRLANTDPLSGLPNRTRFFTAAADEIRRAERYNRPLTVFMVDIDHFKQINDTHGHNVGDLALKAFAELCRHWIRHRDIVARLGGEEFGILLPDTKAASARPLADRLRAGVEAIQMDNMPTRMTVSIGVSEVFPGEHTVDGALFRADQALYAAKHAGRNRVVLYSELAQSDPVQVAKLPHERLRDSETVV